MASEVIAYAAAPRLKLEGPTDSVEVDYGEPGRMAHVPPGHNLSEMRPAGLDMSLAAIADRVSSRIGKSTVPRVLQSGDFPGGTAFATLNLATQSGLKSLTPYKELAEQALADVLTQMLYWLQHHGEPVVAFGQGRHEAGSQVVLKPEDIDAENLYVEVELTADVPTDRMARISAAAMAVRELGYSRVRALEQIGESDPTVVMEEAEAEEMERVALEIEKQRQLALGQAETKRILKEAEAAEQEQVESESGKAYAALSKMPEFQSALAKIFQGQQNKNPDENPTGVGGPGFDPSRGGTPPAMAAPEMTPEMRGKRAAG